MIVETARFHTLTALWRAIADVHAEYAAKLDVNSWLYRVAVGKRDAYRDAANNLEFALRKQRRR